MKYCVVIIDGASGWPLPDRGMKTCLELADIPNLDRIAREGILGLVRTIPDGMEPSSACACMSIIGYDPQIYYKGRSAIEAISMGIPITEEEVGFRCNLVSIREGRMWDYSAGHISDSEAHILIDAVQDRLGSSEIRFYPGVGYRHLCKIRGHGDTLMATCTPPHDIPGEPVEKYLPRGSGSELLRDLMSRSVDVLGGHPVNIERESNGSPAANMIWLFWGSGEIPELPPFKVIYGLSAALTSGVDLLKGLAKMTGITNLTIGGVTAGLDNDYAGQASGAVKALQEHDLVFIHVEAPDEAGHAGNIDDKIKAIECVDRDVIGPLLSLDDENIRILAMPDHPTPIEVRTHVSDPVPFVLWGDGFNSTGAGSFSEAEAERMGIYIEDGYTIMERLVKG